MVINSESDTSNQYGLRAPCDVVIGWLNMSALLWLGRPGIAQSFADAAKNS